MAITLSDPPKEDPEVPRYIRASFATRIIYLTFFISKAFTSLSSF
jgi:hypothetical protein